MRFLVTGDGWSRGEYPAGVWQVPGHVKEPERNRFWRTAGVHSGIAQELQNTFPDADVSVAGGVAHNPAKSVDQVYAWCDWYTPEQCTGVIFFWGDVCTDYNPFNLHDENWHGVDPVDEDQYYILPTNRWQHTGPDEFQELITELADHRLSQLNSIGIPIYMVGGSCSLPVHLMKDYDNLIECVVNAKQLVWGDWEMDWYNPKHILKAWELYSKHSSNKNPVDAELLMWLKKHRSNNWYTPDNLHKWMPDGRHGGRQMHQMIWHQIQNHIKST